MQKHSKILRSWRNRIGRNKNNAALCGKCQAVLERADGELKERKVGQRIARPSTAADNNHRVSSRRDRFCQTSRPNSAHNTPPSLRKKLSRSEPTCAAAAVNVRVRRCSNASSCSGEDGKKDGNESDEWYQVRIYLCRKSVFDVCP